MAKDERYNGWANYETWVVHLWLSNEPGTDAMSREIALGAVSELAAGEAIRDWLTGDDAPWLTPTTGLLADMLTHSFQRVDWREVGAAFREE